MGDVVVGPAGSSTAVVVVVVDVDVLVVVVVSEVTVLVVVVVGSAPAATPAGTNEAAARRGAPRQSRRERMSADESTRLVGRLAPPGISLKPRLGVSDH
jgi:hypothetical protein